MSNEQTKKRAPRAREITVTLSPVVWAEFQRQRDALIDRVGEMPRGVDSLTINEWIADLMKRPTTAAPALAAMTQPTTDGQPFDILDDD